MSPPTDSTASAISAARALVGALEQQVLEEVARARELVGLVARPGADPEADRDRAQLRHRLGDDAQPRVEQPSCGRDRPTPSLADLARGRRGLDVAPAATLAAAAARATAVAAPPPLRPRLGRAEVAELRRGLARPSCPRTTPRRRAPRLDRGRSLAATGPVARLAARSPRLGRGRRCRRRHRRRRRRRARRRRARARACPGCRCRRRAPGPRRRGSSTSSTRSMRLPRPSFEMWSRPSRPGRMLTNAPNLVMFTTLPGVLGADLGGGRVEDQLDAAPGLFDRGAVLRADASRCRRRRRRRPRCRRRSPAVIVLMTLPLGPITSPILSIGISKLTIFGAVSRTSSRGAAIAPRP